MKKVGIGTQWAVLHILHTNDLHGKLTAAHVARIRAMREENQAMWLDSGDCIKTGNLGIPTREEPVWDLFKQGGCVAGTLGNRESHVLASAFRAKVWGAAHSIVCANFRERSGALVYPDALVHEWNGIRIGLVGTMVAMVTRNMKTQAASAYLWDPPIESAVEVCRRIRNDVDVLIALTHIGFTQDRLLAQAAPEIDIILGGHSHTVLEQPVQEGSVWIAQGGSHARFIGQYAFNLGTKTLDGGLVPLGG